MADSINRVQKKIIVPKKEAQTVSADRGYNYMASVIIEPIPLRKYTNDKGGTIINIGD